MTTERERAYRAIVARDARFDGRLFVGVRTTGVFCRPICRARTPRPENVDFFASAAAAQQAGFRPCLLCRPESSPDLAAWRGSSSTVSRALALISEGALDRSDVESLASRLGMGERQLRRLFDKHLGASPVAVAQSRRVLFAKKLVHETSLSMTQIAHASGYGSVRRFNEAFRDAIGKPPTALRRTHGPVGTGATLTLGYSPPYDWPAILAFFRARALPGVEHVEPSAYQRTIRIDGVVGTIRVEPVPGKHALALTVVHPDVTQLSHVALRVRRMFDLDADLGAIAPVLRRDPALRARLRARPGLRVPGAWDPFESAVRAILGQQVSVERARQLATSLLERWGERVSTGAPALTHTFPTPETLAAVLPTARLGMPGARTKALAELARGACDEPRLFSTSTAIDDARALLRTLRGVGSWTEEYVALRALRDPDAFPASDVGLLRALEQDGVRPSPDALLARAEAWRPFRAYAAQHLWAD